MSESSIIDTMFLLKQEKIVWVVIIHVTHYFVVQHSFRMVNEFVFLGVRCTHIIITLSLWMNVYVIIIYTRFSSVQFSLLSTTMLSKNEFLKSYSSQKAPYVRTWAFFFHPSAFVITLPINIVTITVFVCLLIVIWFVI